MSLNSDFHSNYTSIRPQDILSLSGVIEAQPEGVLGLNADERGFVRDILTTFQQNSQLPKHHKITQNEVSEKIEKITERILNYRSNLGAQDNEISALARDAKLHAENMIEIQLRQPGSGSRKKSSSTTSIPNREEEIESDDYEQAVNVHSVLPHQRTNNSATSIKSSALDESKMREDEYINSARAQRVLHLANRRGISQTGQMDQTDYNIAQSNEYQTAVDRLRVQVTDPNFPRKRITENCKALLSDFGHLMRRLIVKYNNNHPNYTVGVSSRQNGTPVKEEADPSNPGPPEDEVNPCNPNDAYYILDKKIQQINELINTVNTIVDIETVQSLTLLADQLSKSYADLCVDLHRILAPKIQRLTSQSPHSIAASRTAQGGLMLPPPVGSQQTVIGRRDAARVHSQLYIRSIGQELYDTLREPVYMVHPGETWESIATLFQNQLNDPEEIVYLANNLKAYNGNSPQPIVGRNIVIPRQRQIANTESVQDGVYLSEEQTLEDLANTLGLSVEEIIRYNELRPNATINEDQLLLIPPIAYYREITVEPDETLDFLADEYEVSPEKICRFNNMSEGSEIVPGQKIVIPPPGYPD